MSGRRSRRSTRTTSPASKRSGRPELGPEGAERSLILLALASAGALLALYFAVVRTYWGQRLDEHAFTGRGVVGGRPAEGADDLLSAISEGTLVLAVLALALLAIAQRKPRMAALSLVVVGGSLLVTEILKYEVLTRPALVPTAVLDNSFPSGHTTIGIAVGLALLLVVPPRLRSLTALGAAVLAVAVGIATVAAGWHRPSDVIAAYLVALGVASAATAGMLRWAPADAPLAGEGGVVSLPRIRRLRIDEVVIGAFVIGGAGLFALALLRAEGVPWTSAGVGFLLSAAAIASAAAAAVLALLIALGRIRPDQPAGGSPTQ